MAIDVEVKTSFNFLLIKVLVASRSVSPYQSRILNKSCSQPRGFCHFDLALVSCERICWITQFPSNLLQTASAETQGTNVNDDNNNDDDYNRAFYSTSCQWFKAFTDIYKQTDINNNNPNQTKLLLLLRSQRYLWGSPFFGGGGGGGGRDFCACDRF